MSGVYDLTILNEVLKEKGLQPIGATAGIAVFQKQFLKLFYSIPQIPL